MGQKIQLAETFTGTGLPVLYDDSLMNAGSLVLLDLGHSLGGVTGVPAGGAVLPNVAWKTANALVSGAPGQSALGIPLTATSAAAPSYPVIERTPKLGLHAIRSQTSDVSGATYALGTPAAISAYLQANPTHKYYFSIWDNVTRKTTVGQAAPNPGVTAFGSNAGNFLFAIPGWDVYPGGGAQFLGKNISRGTPLSTNTGSGIIQMGFTTVTGSPTYTSTVLYGFGGQAGFWSGYRVGSSQILYRMYLEDLTVSGRTYAAAAAADLALYTAAFAPGGKFYGDTFTNPAGFP